MKNMSEMSGLSQKFIGEQGLLTEGSKCIYEYFNEVAKDNPYQPCIEYCNKVYTYNEIGRKANKLARYIKNLGAGPENLIAIYQERSPEMIISILAIIKAGAAFVPISTAYPKERIEYIINDVDVKLIITDSILEQELTDIHTEKQVKHVLLDKESEQIEKEKDSNLPSQNDISNLIYVIFTSGSTGKPKGVMIEHRGIPNLVFEQIKTFKLNKNDRVLQFASSSFDASISEIFTTLIAGATLVLLPDDNLYLGEDLYQFLIDKKISVVTLTPSVLNTLPSKDLPELKTLVSAGEACSKQLISNWASKLNFINAYGPTECTVCASMNICSSSDETVSLGKPIANTVFYLLDEDLNPVLNGEIGELCISCLGLARGYINMPSITESSFIANPFHDGISDRLYRTGDLCRQVSGDSIEWEGRKDNQVKIAGLRVDLDEIVHILREYRGIQDAVVIIVDDNSKAKQIYSYIITNSTTQLHIRDIKSHLRTKVPAYMVPSKFMFIKEIPVLESGKLDRNSLPAMESIRPQLDVDYVQPTNQMEKTLTQIWSEILQIDKIGIYDNFFDLGGQSLMATQIVSRIRSNLGMEIPLHVIFDLTPTIEQMAKAIENYQLEQSEPDELERLLLEIESMSEEEIAAALQ